MKELIGKSFLVDTEEFVVEEILLGKYKCSCRNYYSDNTQLFFCDFVKKKVSTYEQDLKELKKSNNAFVFKEDNEKTLLKKIVQLYNSKTCIADLSSDELDALIKINSKLSI